MTKKLWVVSFCFYAINGACALEISKNAPSTHLPATPTAASIYDVAAMDVRDSDAKNSIRSASSGEKYATDPVVDSSSIVLGTEIVQQANEAAQLRKEQQRFGLPWLPDTTFGAAYRQTMGRTSSLIAGVFLTEFKADPEWIDERNRNWINYVAGFNNHEQESLMIAKSKAEYDYRVELIRIERIDRDTLSNASASGRSMALLASWLIHPIVLLMVFCAFIFYKSKFRKAFLRLIN